MRPLLIGTAALALGAGVALGWEALKPRARPVIAVEEEVDLGSRKFGEIVTAPLRVANRGAGALSLTDFRTSCSCAGVEALSGGQMRGVRSVNLAPGSSADLVVRIAVGAAAGSGQTVTVRFATDDPAHPTATVLFTIPFVTSDVVTEVTALDFGPLDVGETMTRTFTVYEGQMPGRRIGRVSCRHPDRFAVRTLPVPADRPPPDHPHAGRAIALVEVSPVTATGGAFFSEVTVELDGQSGSSCRVPVTSEVFPAVLCTPASLALPRMTAGRLDGSATLVLSSRDGSPVRVTGVTPPPGLTAKIVGAARDLVHIELSAGDRRSAAGGRTPILMRVETGTGEVTLQIPVSLN